MGAGCSCVPVPPAWQERLWEGAEAHLMQRHVHHGHPVFPPDLRSSLALFRRFSLQPGRWGRKKALGWERLCAGFMAGAHSRVGIGALSSLSWVSRALGRAGGSNRSAGASLHRTRRDPCIATACSPVAKDSSWGDAAGGLWMDDPLLVKHTTGKLWVLFPSVYICMSNDCLGSRHTKSGWMEVFPKGCDFTSAAHPFQRSSVARRRPRRR